MKEHYKMPIFWKVAEWIKHLCGRWEVESTPFLTKLLETNLQKTPSTHSSLEFSCTVSLKRGEVKVFYTKKNCLKTKTATARVTIISLPEFTAW